MLIKSRSIPAELAEFFSIYLPTKLLLFHNLFQILNTKQELHTYILNTSCFQVASDRVALRFGAFGLVNKSLPIYHFLKRLLHFQYITSHETGPGTPFLTGVLARALWPAKSLGLPRATDHYRLEYGRHRGEDT